MLIDRALAAKRESKTIDFKRSFDVDVLSDWCEIVKDLVAMANSGGGILLIGVEDDGSPASSGSASAILSLDPAKITDKVARYTGVQFDGFNITESMRNGQAVGVIVVDGSTRPLVFEKPGTYPMEEGRQKTAFSTGSLYVRHGAKSEPATSDDMARIIERILTAHHREWMSGLKKVVSAPIGSSVSILPRGVRQSLDSSAMPIRITADPSAPEYRLTDTDATHPFRQKELIKEVNSRIPGGSSINQFDIQAVRHVYAIDGQHRYFHKSRFATAQYSPEFRDWLVTQFLENRAFFTEARREFSGRRSAS